MTDKTDDEYTVPFSMRLTRAQRRKLDTDAGNMTVGAYVRRSLFENPTPQKRVFRRPLLDEQTLTKLLGALGRSHLSSNLNQIAKAIHTGAYPVTPEAEKALIEACFAVQKMRAELETALGLPPENPQ